MTAYGCECSALPAALQAKISHFSIKKVVKNGFFGYSVLRKKSEISDEKLEGKIGPVMEVHMDANRTRSQLRYGPKSTVPKRNRRNDMKLKCGRKLNPLLSQLRYRPRYSIQLLYYTRFLKNVKPNFEDIYEKRPDLEK